MIIYQFANPSVTSHPFHSSKAKAYQAMANINEMATNSQQFSRTLSILYLEDDTSLNEERNCSKKEKVMPNKEMNQQAKKKKV